MPSDKRRHKKHGLLRITRQLYRTCREKWTQESIVTKERYINQHAVDLSRNDLKLTVDPSNVKNMFDWVNRTSRMAPPAVQITDNTSFDTIIGPFESHRLPSAPALPNIIDISSTDAKLLNRRLTKDKSTGDSYEATSTGEWDGCINAGGPVWAIEFAPESGSTPSDATPASELVSKYQYDKYLAVGLTRFGWPTENAPENNDIYTEDVKPTFDQSFGASGYFHLGTAECDTVDGRFGVGSDLQRFVGQVDVSDNILQIWVVSGEVQYSTRIAPKLIYQNGKWLLDEKSLMTSEASSVKKGRKSREKEPKIVKPKGRPRKPIPLDENGNPLPKVPKKKGRPRLPQQLDENGNVIPWKRKRKMGEDGLPKRRGRPPTKPKVEKTPNKARGRPRKSTSLGDEDKDEEEESKCKKDKDNDSDGSTGEVINLTGSSSKSGRVRKPVQQYVAAPASGKLAQSQSLNTPKRKYTKKGDKPIGDVSMVNDEDIDVDAMDVVESTVSSGGDENVKEIVIEARDVQEEDLNSNASDNDSRYSTSSDSGSGSESSEEEEEEEDEEEDVSDVSDEEEGDDSVNEEAGQQQHQQRQQQQQDELSSSSSFSTPVVRLAYCVALDKRGPTWGLSWCPHIKSNKTSTQSGLYASLLGVLAVVCGDGSCLILVLPKNNGCDTVSSSTNKKSQQTAFRDIPVLEESAVFRIVIRAPQNAMITAVCWDSHRPFHLLCGMVDGSITFWSLQQYLFQTDSTTLSQPYMRIIDPEIDSSIASFSAVTSLSVCPYDSDLILVSGYNKDVKIWNRNDVFQPLYKRGNLCSVSHVEWDPMGLGYYMCLSETTTPYWDSLWVLEKYPNSIQRVNLYSHVYRFGGIWQTTCFESDGHSFIISVASDGSVRGGFCSALALSKDLPMDTCLTELFRVLSVTPTVVPAAAIADQNSSSSGSGEKHSPAGKIVVSLGTDDCRKTYAIDAFTNQNAVAMHSVAATLLSHSKESDCHGQGSYHLVAYGGAAGIVRIHTFNPFKQLMQNAVR